MWYIIGITALLAVSTAGFFTKKNNESMNKASDFLKTSINISSLKSLSKTEVNMLLARLKVEKAPESVMGAMCYSPMMLPASAEYVCPVCGEKTLYESSNTAFIEWELAGCRRMVESINQNTDFEVTLQEELYCDFCSPNPDEDNPTLFLKTTYENGDEFINQISPTDLRMLDSFVQGNLYYSTSNDARYPLQDYAERMAILLGLENK